MEKQTQGKTGTDRQGEAGLSCFLPKERKKKSEQREKEMRRKNKTHEKSQEGGANAKQMFSHLNPGGFGSTSLEPLCELVPVVPPHPWTWQREGKSLFCCSQCDFLGCVKLFEVCSFLKRKLSPI